MKKTLFFLCLLLFMSCGNEGEQDQIQLFNLLAFNIASEESLENLDLRVKNVYKDNFEHEKVQIPLFKYIKHAEYDLFIGLPFNTNLEELNEAFSKKHGTTIRDTLSNDLISICAQSAFKKGFIKECVLQKEGSLIYTSVYSDSQKTLEKIDLGSRVVEIDK